MSRARKASGATNRNGATHQARRRQFAPAVATGNVRCARCGQPILPGQAWDLDHAPGKNGYLGPSHRSCNRADGALKANQLRRRTRRPAIISVKLGDDYAPGTMCVNGDGTADTYDGTNWETVSTDEARTRYKRAYSTPG